ncbi:MAG: helix-turn-helix domain-containing protein [Candidatus Helarchaeota archaeon]
MSNILNDAEIVHRHEEFLKNLMGNELTVPNEFTLEMGKLIRAAREERGLSQTELAEKLSKRQATISDFETGKIEIGILTLVQLAIVFGKPISYFIPEMTFLVSLSDIHNKWEEEALSLFRNMEYEGDPQLALRLLKTLDEYFVETRDQEWGTPDKE